MNKNTEGGKHSEKMECSPNMQGNNKKRRNRNAI
jgi:hypothetical protein